MADAAALRRVYPHAKPFCRCGHPDYYHDAYQFLLFFIRRGHCTWWSIISSDRDCKCKGYQQVDTEPPRDPRPGRGVRKETR